MKKIFSRIIFLSLFLLAACGTQTDWKVEITKPLQFVKGKDTPFEIKITDQGKPVTGVSATAEIAMVNMNHGNLNIRLEEGEKGLYSGTAIPTMAGEYEVILTLKQDGRTFEKVLKMEIKTTEDAATINGEPITREDLDFYRFINELHIAINREADRITYQGSELDERMAYWDSQEKLNQDKNQLLTQIIRLRAIAMLAMEKGYHASDAEVEAEISKIRDKYSQSAVASTLIAQFGEERFWKIEQKQYQLIVLTQKVQNDVKEQVRKENPSVGDQEINFLAKKKYEDLLISQVNSLEIVIL